MKLMEFNGTGKRRAYMNCYSCGKLKNELHPINSRVLKGVTVLMCQSCIDDGMEPRWIVVLGGKTFGPDHVKDFIVKRKYCGKVIAAEELITAQD